MSVCKEALSYNRHVIKSLWKARLLAVALLQFMTTDPSFAASRSDRPQSVPKKVIGPITTVEETETTLSFEARVDTGATTSSVHTEKWHIEGESDKMSENIGKSIRFKIKNHRGQSEWVTRKIADISVVKTSELEEWRYKVPMTLRHRDVTKRVLVTLNDRSHMNFPLLLGRNFLRGDFVVDVDLPGPRGREKRKPRAETEQRTASGNKQEAKR